MVRKSSFSSYCPFFVVLVPFVVNPFVIAEDSLSHRAWQILNQHCLRCHNEETTRGALDLSTRESALQSGATNDALVLHEPMKSSIYLRAQNGSMPPDRDGRKLNADELAILRNWIIAGANWPTQITLQNIPLSRSATSEALPTTPIHARCRADKHWLHFRRRK